MYSHSKAIYRLYAWTLLILFGTSVLANAMHVHFGNCTHLHDYWENPLEHKMGDDSEAYLTVDHAQFSVINCQWGDFTSPQADSLGFSTFVVSLFSPLHPIQESYYQSLLFSQGKCASSLRGPPSIS